MLIDGMDMQCRNEADKRVCREVIGKRVYEMPRLGFVLHPHSVWLDIGANIGAFAVWAGQRRAKHIVAIEPCVENFDLLQRNTDANRSPAECFRKAVAIESGVCTIKYNADTPARSGEFAHKGKDEICEAVGFNNLISEYKPDGIKMDAEGAELAILDNGMNMNGVGFLVMEYHARFDKLRENARRRLAPLVEMFRDHRIPRSLIEGEGEFPSWVDPICFFWN